MTVVIREFEREDAESLWDVFHSSIHGLACRDYSPEQLAAWAPPQYDAALWLERMTKMQPLVAERDGCIVGYAGLRSDGYVDHFYVAAVAACSGVGNALMQRIHELAEVWHLMELHSEVSRTARGFFERRGFAVVAEQTVVVRGVELTNFRMRKLLAPQV